MTVSKHDINRLETLVKRSQRISLLTSPIIAWCALSALVSPVTMTAWFLFWILFIAACSAIDAVLKLFFTAMSVFMIAASPTPQDEICEDDNEDETSSVREATFTILAASEKVVGKYKDVEYVEWLDLIDDEGNQQRAEFFGIADLNGNVTLSEGCFILPPGIIYQIISKT